MSKKPNNFYSNLQHESPNNPNTHSSMSPKSAIYLMVMASIMGGAIIAANLTAIKIWDLVALIRNFLTWLYDIQPAFMQNLPSGDRLLGLISKLDPLSLAVDGGIIVFPITYILGDLLSEIYGKRIANIVANCNFALGLGFCAILWIVSLLPNYVNADNSAFVTISSMVSRIFIASLISFWLSQRVNNHLFATLRKQEKSSYQHRGFAFRAFFSSVAAHFVDSFIFETIAFIGRIPLGEFISQAIFAYIAGIALETALLPITKRFANSLSKKLQPQD